MKFLQTHSFLIVAFVLVITHSAQGAVTCRQQTRELTIANGKTFGASICSWGLPLSWFRRQYSNKTLFIHTITSVQNGSISDQLGLRTGHRLLVLALNWTKSNWSINSTHILSKMDQNQLSGAFRRLEENVPFALFTSEEFHTVSYKRAQISRRRKPTVTNIDVFGGGSGAYPQSPSPKGSNSSGLTTQRRSQMTRPISTTGHRNPATRWFSTHMSANITGPYGGLWRFPHYRVKRQAWDVKFNHIKYDTPVTLCYPEMRKRTKIQQHGFIRYLKQKYDNSLMVTASTGSAGDFEKQTCEDFPNSLDPGLVDFFKCPFNNKHIQLGFNAECQDGGPHRQDRNSWNVPPSFRFSATPLNMPDCIGNSQCLAIDGNTITTGTCDKYYCQNFIIYNNKT